jgi:sec-independent protein translocase protein TatA
MFGLSPVEVVVIGAIAVMLYGKRLPEVGRTVGQGIGELRRQWATLSRDLDVASQIDAAAAPKRRSRRLDDEGSAGPQVAVPRFDPPPESD